MTDKEKNAIDEIAQSTLDAIRDRKISGLKEIKDNQQKYITTTPTVKEMEKVAPSIIEMITRIPTYISKEEQQKLSKHAEEEKMNKEPQHIKPEDYNKTFPDWTKIYHIDIGAEAVVDGKKLAEQYYLNIMDKTVDELINYGEKIQANGGEFVIHGGMVWRATIAQKERKLNKGNNAGI